MTPLNPQLPQPSTPAAPMRAPGEATQIYPRPIEMKITRGRRRAWVWVARQTGVSLWSFLERAGDGAAIVLAERLRVRRVPIPADIAATLATFQEGKNP